MTLSAQTYAKRASEGLLCETIDHETVILRLDDGSSYSLNRVGTFIWELADGRKTIARIASMLCEQYDVTPEVALQDTLELAEGLVTRGLMTVDTVPFALEGSLIGDKALTAPE